MSSFTDKNGISWYKPKKVTPPFPLYKRFPTSIERFTYRRWNVIRNHLHPISPWVYIGGIGAAAAYHVKKPENALLALVPGQKFLEKFVEDQVALWIRIGAVSFTTATLPVLLTRAFLRHFYFAYKGFLFDNPKNPSLTTKIWALVHKAMSKLPLQLNSCDALLPTLPLPPLKDTVDKYLESMEEIFTKEEFEVVKEQAKEFLVKEGPKLQFYARALWWTTDNYVTGLWEKYAYLYGRVGLLINSTVANGDVVKLYPAIPAMRAARIVYIESRHQIAMDCQDYQPLGGGVVCAVHYDKLYSTTRVPGDEIDHLENHGISKHFLIFHQGVFYKAPLCDSYNRLYEVEDYFKIISEVLERKEKEDSPLGRIAALTTDKRDIWAANRRRFFLADKLNSETLKTIESAAFIVVLSDEDDIGWSEENPRGLDKLLLSNLTGTGIDRWADKSLTYAVTKNARGGGTIEHSVADGAEFDHIMETHAYLDRYVLGPTIPIEEQEKLAERPRQTARPNVKFAERLKFNVSEEMANEIERSYASYLPERDDVDLAATYFRDWGKGRIKKANCSPDAFFQMAIQLANFKDQGRFVQTYEPASVRFYKNSRTETLRSCTKKSCAFVRSMFDPSKDKATRIKLLREACELHVANNKQCMIGKGFDRHLFVLYVLSKGFNISSPFLDSVFAQQWLLSTSQIPVVTDLTNDDADPSSMWFGACFGAVAKKGYGLCYRFAANNAIMCHITSYKSAENTDSHRFQQHLIDSLNEMIELFN